MKDAIERWEDQEKEIQRLRFFWFSGLACFLAGIGCYRFVNRWLGLAGLIIGVLEMIYWTSPSFFVRGAQAEFDRLLTQKLIFTALTWILLVGAWLLAMIEARGEKKSNNQP